MAKYKPEQGDVINFKRDDKICSGTIRWIASSGFILVMDHNLPIKTSKGAMYCDIFIEANDVIGKKSKNL